MEGAFEAIAGNILVDWLSMLTLLGVGLALVLGIALRPAAAAGICLLLAIRAAIWMPDNNPFIDEHIIYVILLVCLPIARAGTVGGSATRGRPCPSSGDTHSSPDREVAVKDHVRYLAEEVAYDHADGLLSRRDALRQLGALGLGAVGAASFLAACGSDKTDNTATTARPDSATTAGTGPPRPPTTPVATEAVGYAGPNGTLQGVWAAAASPRGVVVVNHENRGITPFITSVVGRLAGDGYSALAVDLLSEEGGTASVADVPAALAAAPPERFIADMQVTVDEAARRQPGAAMGVIGFCFGGNMTWLMVENEPRLVAAAPFYGQVRSGVDFSRGRAAVLGVYAERDSRVNATREEAKAALEKAGLPHEIRTFSGVDHAFFNDTNPARYNATQAAAAYSAVLDWFDRFLG